MMQQAEQVQSTALSVISSTPLAMYTGVRRGVSSSNNTDSDIRGTLVRISVSIASTASTLGMIASMLRAYIKKNEIALTRQKYIDLENQRERLAYSGDTGDKAQVSATGGGFSLMDFITSTPLIVAALTGLASYLLPKDLKDNLLEYGKNLILGMTGLDEAYKQLEQSYNNARTKLEEFFNGDLIDTLSDIVTDLSLVLAGLALIKSGKRPPTDGRTGPVRRGRMALGGAIAGIGAARAADAVTGGMFSDIYKDVTESIKDMVGMSEVEDTPPNERAKKALEYFVGQGYTPEQAAGIVGNLQAESGMMLDPAALGDSGTAYGIAQWRGSRQEDFKTKFKKPIQESTFDEQLEFIAYELKNKERKADEALRKARTPEKAAEVFAREYERPQLDPSKVDPSKVIGKRQTYAENLYGNYLKGNAEQRSTPAARSIAPAPTATNGTRAMNSSVQNQDMKEIAGRTSVTSGSLPATTSQVGDKPPQQKPVIPRPSTTTPDLDRSMFFSPAY